MSRGKTPTGGLEILSLSITAVGGQMWVIWHPEERALASAPIHMHGRAPANFQLYFADDQFALFALAIATVKFPSKCDATVQRLREELCRDLLTWQ